MARLVKVSLPSLSRAEQPGFEPLPKYQRSVSSTLNLVTYHIASVFIQRVLGICIMPLAYWITVKIKRLTTSSKIYT